MSGRGRERERERERDEKTDKDREERRRDEKRREDVNYKRTLSRPQPDRNALRVGCAQCGMQRQGNLWRRGRRTPTAAHHHIRHDRGATIGVVDAADDWMLLHVLAAF